MITIESIAYLIGSLLGVLVILLLIKQHFWKFRRGRNYEYSDLLEKMNELQGEYWNVKMELEHNKSELKKVKRKFKKLK